MSTVGSYLFHQSNFHQKLIENGGRKKMIHLNHTQQQKNYQQQHQQQQQPEYFNASIRNIGVEHTSAHTHERFFLHIYSRVYQTHVPESNAKHCGKPVFGCKFVVCYISGKQHIAEHGCSLSTFLNANPTFWSWFSPFLSLTVCACVYIFFFSVCLNISRWLGEV